MRREHEVLRTEFERYTVSQSQEKESTYVAHREVVGGLHNRIDDLRARADDPRPAEEIRSLKRRLEESGVRQTRLRAEAEAAVAARVRGLDHASPAPACAHTAPRGVRRRRQRSLPTRCAWR